MKYFTVALWFLVGLVVAVVFQTIKNICRMCVTILDKMEVEENWEVLLLGVFMSE